MRTFAMQYLSLYTTVVYVSTAYAWLMSSHDIEACGAKSSISAKMFSFLDLVVLELFP